MPHQIRQRRCQSCGGGLTGASNLAVPLLVSGAPGETWGSSGDAVRLSALFEGERKHLTVLFADIVDSSRLVAGVDPEEAQALLLPPLQTMIDTVRRYGGTVTQILGDGIMALFGAPYAQEDHAVKACLAAMAMQDRMSDPEAQLEEVGDVRIRVGLNSGGVVVRAIDNDIHIDYRAIGETVFMAARMETCAGPGGVALTGDTYRLAERYVEARRIDCTNLKHLPDCLEAFELTRVRNRPSYRDRSSERVLSRFVGRNAEIAMLRDALGRAQTGNGCAVAMSGPPGVGKSRLFDEFFHDERLTDWTVFECHLVSHDLAAPTRPAREFVRTLLEIDDDDDERKIRVKVARKLSSFGTVPEHYRPALLALLGVTPQIKWWHGLEPPERHRQTLDAVVGLITSDSQARPIAIVFEDLHAIDSETQGLLDALIPRLLSTRVLVLVNYRPDYSAAWTDLEHVTVRRIEPLSSDQAAELLDQSLGEDATLDPLKRLLVERTEGVPFFLEESVRALVEEQAVVGERGSYRLVAPIPTLEVPATVRAVLAARIDRLPQNEKHLLLTASVLGKNVNVALLRDIADMPGEAFREGLDRLRAAEFLDAGRLFPDAQLSFHHALTHEVAYGTLLRSRRRLLHGRIVSAIETRYANRLDSQVERLAHHARQGELWGKALAYCRQAGSKALARSANREAVLFLEGALVALDQLPASQDHARQAIDVRIDLGNALFPLGEQRRVLDCIRQASELCEKLNDRYRLAKASSLLTTYYWMSGDLDRAIDSALHAKAVAEELGEAGFWIHACNRLNAAYFARGDYQRACDVAFAVLERPESEHGDERFGLAASSSVACLASLAWSLAELGDFDRAVGLGDKGLRLAETSGHPFSLAYAKLYVGVASLRRGAPKAALPLLERAHQICQASAIRLLAPMAAAALGHAYTQSGHAGDGIPLLESAVDRANEMKLVVRLSLIHAWLSEAYAAAGRLDDALQQAEQAFRHARRQGERGIEAWCCWSLAELHARQGQAGAASAASFYRQASALAETLKMRPLVAHCHFGLGMLAGRLGRTAEMRDELEAAASRYRALDMTASLKHVEEALADDDTDTATGAVVNTIR